MGDAKKRRAIRRLLADMLLKFYHTLLTGVAADAEGFLRRVEFSLRRCPVCGDEMMPSISEANVNPRCPNYIFVCAKCGVSYFAES